jgi:hypothetical protein
LAPAYRRRALKSHGVLGELGTRKLGPLILAVVHPSRRPSRFCRLLLAWTLTITLRCSRTRSNQFRRWPLRAAKNALEERATPWLPHLILITTNNRLVFWCPYTRRRRVALSVPPGSWSEMQPGLARLPCVLTQPHAQYGNLEVPCLGGCRVQMRAIGRPRCCLRCDIIHAKPVFWPPISLGSSLLFDLHISTSISPRAVPFQQKTTYRRPHRRSDLLKDSG